MARYAFLKEKEKLENKYKMEFPFGSGTQADKFAEKFNFYYLINNYFSKVESKLNITYLFLIINNFLTSNCFYIIKQCT